MMFTSLFYTWELQIEGAMNTTSKNTALFSVLIGKEA